MTAKRGRPVGSKKDEPKAERVNISLTPAQAEKLRMLGGSRWIQSQLDKAK